jgi:ribosomal protein RSM22 (predicted rRNA methylase)
MPVQLRDAIELETAPFTAKQLAEAAAELSEKYRARKSPTSRYMATQAERLAYLNVRMPATFAAASAVLAEIEASPIGQSIESILDLGAGPGTVGWAAAETLRSLQAIVFIEEDSELIGLGRSLVERSESALLKNAVWKKMNLEQTVEFEPHDLVVCSYSLGEIHRNPAGLLKQAWQATRQAIALIEPGTPQGFDLIRRSREQLIGLGAHIAAPCPHERACPMPPDDWCHFSARFDRSPLHRRLKAGSLGYEDEKYAYLVATRSPLQMAQARVLRRPFHEPGAIRLELCAEDELKTLIVKRKDQEHWKRARKTAWGQVWGGE